MPNINSYQHLLIYEDINTEFIFLRPLKKKNVSEVASQLMEIFGIIGAPKVIQTVHRPILADALFRLNNIWPQIKTLHSGSPPPHQVKNGEEN